MTSCCKVVIPLLYLLLLLLAHSVCVALPFIHHATSTSPRTPSAQFDLPAIKSDLAVLMASSAGADNSLAPFFVMLAWHSAASYSTVTQQGGTDGANIRFPPESLWPQNRPVAPALRLLQQLRHKHNNSISLADILTLAGVVAVEQVNGPSIPWRAGRTDSSHSPLPATLTARIPSPRSSSSALHHSFGSLSLTPREMVALTGAHTLGRCHRTLSGYDGQWTHQPLHFTADFFRQLSTQQWRPRQWDGPLQYENVRVAADGREVAGGLMMLPSDLALLERNDTREWVERYAADERLLFDDFSAAYGKLLQLGVKFYR